MENIRINKALNLDDESIEIRYEGIAQKDYIDIDSIDQLLEDFIENHNHEDMIKNVAIVRTILRDYKEILLDIFYKNKKGSEHVRYDKSKLFFEKTKNKDDEYQEEYKIKYKTSDGIKIEHNDHELDFSDYSQIKSFSQKMSEIAERIYYLQRVKAITLDNNSKALIEIYKLFYNEKPDFSSKDISVKVQTMMCILSQFGISLGMDCNFSFHKNDQMPTSLIIEQIVNELYPLGKIASAEDNIQLHAMIKEIIKIVGESIRESIKEDDDLNEILIKISRIIHVGRYHFSPNFTDTKEIAETVECTQNEVEESIRLVKHIKNKIDKVK